MDTSSPAHPFSPTTPGPVAPGPGTPSSSATTTTAPAVCARGLTRAYGRGDAQVHALRGVDVDFASGAFTAIMGPSGSGKSTLLHCLAGLDARTSGSVRIGGTEITGLDDTALTRLRRDRVGFVFQAFNLVPTLTAEQNIVLPLELAGRTPDRAWLDEITRNFPTFWYVVSDKSGEVSYGPVPKWRPPKTQASRDGTSFLAYAFDGETTKLKKMAAVRNTPAGEVWIETGGVAYTASQLTTGMLTDATIVALPIIMHHNRLPVSLRPDSLTIRYDRA